MLLHLGLLLHLGPVITLVPSTPPRLPPPVGLHLLCISWHLWTARVPPPLASPHPLACISFASACIPGQLLGYPSPHLPSSIGLHLLCISLHPWTACISGQLLGYPPPLASPHPLACISFASACISGQLGYPLPSPPPTPHRRHSFGSCSVDQSLFDQNSNKQCSFWLPQEMKEDYKRFQDYTHGFHSDFLMKWHKASRNKVNVGGTAVERLDRDQALVFNPGLGQTVIPPLRLEMSRFRSNFAFLEMFWAWTSLLGRNRAVWRPKGREREFH